MCDADIELLDDDCLSEIFERMSLVDQICASKVCRRWKILCRRLLKKVYKFSGDGHTWQINDKDGSIVTATADSEDLKTILASCSKYIEILQVNGKHIPRDPSVFQLIMGITTARCGNLRCISLELISDVIILTLIPIMIQRSKNLLDLKLTDIYHLNLHAVVQHLPECLNEFQILNLTPTDPNVLVQLLGSSRRLTSFTCNYVPDVVAEFIGSQKQLEQLRLHFAFTISESFNHIAQLKNLLYLDVDNSIHMKDENLVNIARNCPQLRCLIMCWCKEITDIGVSSLANLERLKVLRMTDLIKVTEASIAILPASLQVLCFCGCEEVKDNGAMQVLTRATDLRVLCMAGSKITNITIEAAIRIVRDQESSRNLKIFAHNTGANLETIDATLMAELPPSLELYFQQFFHQNMHMR